MACSARPPNQEQVNANSACPTGHSPSSGSASPPASASTNPIFADTLGGFRDPSNVRRSLREALSPVGSTARRDLGLSLRAARRESGITRKDVAQTLEWPLTRIELIETGRTKVDREVATTLLRAYGIQLETSTALLALVDEAAGPAPSDTLAWITSHAFRKPPPPSSTTTGGLGPGDQIGRGQGEFQPGGVDREQSGREPAQAGVLGY